MSTPTPEPLITVAIASQESGLTEREVWTIIHEQAVPVVRGPRARMRTAKFRREDWAAGLERSLAPTRPPKVTGDATPRPGATGKTDPRGWDECLDILKQQGRIKPKR
jgi:hypothetical protein